MAKPTDTVCALATDSFTVKAKIVVPLLPSFAVTSSIVRPGSTEIFTVATLDSVLPSLALNVKPSVPRNPAGGV